MTAPLSIPDWVATVVGRLTLENELLRLRLIQQQAEQAAQVEDTPGTVHQDPGGAPV